MNGKPRNYNAMLKVVDYCTWPGLTSTEKHILAAISKYANENGFSAFVSNAMLCVSVGRCERTIRDGLHSLEEKEVLACLAHRKGGRNRAPEWKFVFSHPAYPNQSPNGREWFSDIPRDSGPDKGGNKGGSASDTKGATEAPKGGNPGTERGQSGAEKGATSCPPSYSSSKDTSETFHPNPAGGGWNDFVFSLPKIMHGAVPNKNQRHMVEKQLEKYGPDLKYHIIGWIRQRAMPLEGRADRWGAWLAECGPYIKRLEEIQAGTDEEP